MSEEDRRKSPDEFAAATGPLVDAMEISRITGIPVQTIWRACRDRSIPHYRLARTVRFDPLEVLRHIRCDSATGEPGVPGPDDEFEECPNLDERVSDAEWWRNS